MTDLISKPTVIPDPAARAAPAARAFLQPAKPRSAPRDIEAEIEQRRWPVWKSVLFLGLSAAILWGGIWMLIIQLLKLLR